MWENPRLRAGTRILLSSGKGSQGRGPWLMTRIQWNLLGSKVKEDLEPPRHACVCLCLCMGVCTCVYVSLHVCTCVYVYLSVCTCVHLCMCTRACVYMCVCICACVCVHVCQVFCLASPWCFSTCPQILTFKVFSHATFLVILNVSLWRSCFFFSPLCRWANWGPVWGRTLSRSPSRAGTVQDFFTIWRLMPQSLLLSWRCPASQSRRCFSAPSWAPRLVPRASSLVGCFKFQPHLPSSVASFGLPLLWTRCYPVFIRNRIILNLCYCCF